MHLNRQQIAESFGVSESVVQDWVDHEALPHVMDREQVIFPRNAVAAWAAARGLADQSGFLADETMALNAEPTLAALLQNGGIWRNVAAEDARNTLAKVVAELPGVSAPIRQLLGQRIQSSDGLAWAPVGHGFALPHLRARVALGRNAGVVALVMLRDARPLEESSPDGDPVKHLLFFIAPVPRDHLDLLARLTRLTLNKPFTAALQRAADDDTILRAVTAADITPKPEKPGAA